MLSEEQYQEKLKKVKYVVTSFLKEKKTIKQIADESGELKISKSSVQRYLNDEQYIKILFGEEAPFIIEEIERRLIENYSDGVKLGGNNFAQNNESLKDENGHFIGSRKK